MFNTVCNDGLHIKACYTVCNGWLQIKECLCLTQFVMMGYT